MKDFAISLNVYCFICIIIFDMNLAFDADKLMNKNKIIFIYLNKYSVRLMDLFFVLSECLGSMALKLQEWTIIRRRGASAMAGNRGVKGARPCATHAT